VLPYPPKSGLKFIVGYHDEPEMLVERTVPGNVDEGREGEGWTSGFNCPRLHRFEQILTEALALVVRQDADLLDVGVAVYDIDNDVANRSITLVHGYPTASPAGVIFEHLDRHGISVGYPLHADRPERLSGEHFDLPEPLTLR